MAVFSARAADVGFCSRDFAVHSAAAVALGLGLLILLGWQFDVALLKSGLTGERATQPLTAVCLCLCAVCLSLSASAHSLYQLLGRVGAGLVLTFVMATVWQNALDTDWGLDRLLFPDAIVHEQPGQYLRPGRTAGATLVALGLLVFCLLLVSARERSARGAYVLFATLGALFSVTVVLAYLLSVDSLYPMGLYAHVSLGSAVILGILFAGVLARRPDTGWMRVLSGDTVGGASARRLLLGSVPLLIVVSCIVRVGTSHSAFGSDFAVLLVALVGIGLLFGGVIWHAERLNGLEQARHAADSRLRNVERDLQVAGRSKDAFVALLAHELRNPLASLRNGIEIVRRTAGPDPARALTAQMMGRQMNQLVRLVDDLLDLSRIDRDTIELQRERILLRSVVDSAVELCRDSIAARKHELRIVASDERIAVNGDFQRLVQVVSNVLSNSTRYTEPGGRIAVEILREGPRASVRISDTGVGIPPEALEPAFETFAQLRAHRAYVDGGLGVGLALVRSLVELHGGTVTAQRHVCGAGSTFVISLPALAEENPDPQSAHAHVQTAPLRILVADDNTDAAASLAELLRLEGHEVRTAVDGIQTVDVAEQMRPDVIFLDIGMPRLDGVETARRIRARPWGGNTRLVALTGWGQASERSRTQAAGIDHHLLKPVEPRELAQILRSIRCGTRPV